MTKEQIMTMKVDNPFRFQISTLVKDDEGFTGRVVQITTDGNYQVANFKGTKKWYSETENSHMYMGLRPLLTEFSNDDNMQLMVTAAHRYCLGRRSYIVGAALDWIWQRRGAMNRNTLCVMVRDTVEALQDNAAGSEYIDAPGWKNLATKLYNEMPQEDQDWVRHSVAHRDKGWPL